MTAKILVTPRSLTREGDPALELLKSAGYELVLCTPGKAPDEEELIRLLPGCVGWLAGVEKISERVLRTGRDLKAISRNGTGVDSIDLDACRKLGIPVLRAEGANARGVAELTIALLLSLMRSLPFSDSRMKAGGWERRKGTELEGRTPRGDRLRKDREARGPLRPGAGHAGDGLRRVSRYILFRRPRSSAGLLRRRSCERPMR